MLYGVRMKYGFFLSILLILILSFAGCTSFLSVDQEITNISDTITDSQNQTSDKQNDLSNVVATFTPISHQVETRNATAGPEGEFSQSRWGLTQDELLLIQQRSPIYLAHPNEIPVLFDTNDSPVWTGPDKMKLIEIALNDPRVRENIDSGGMIIGVSLCIHPTTKGSDSMGGPALRIFNNGTVTDYIVNEDTGEGYFLCIGPVEQVKEFRDRQLNLDSD